MSGKIYAVRHGRTALNQGGETSVDRIRGWSDIKLTSDGVAEAKAVAKQLEGKEISLVIASDLARSEQTGKAIARHLGVPLRTTRGLRPWGLGCLTGRPSKDAAPIIEHFARDAPTQPVPSGESFNAFTGRLSATLERLQRTVAKSGATIALISHYRDLKAIDAGIGQGKKPGELDLDRFTRDDILPGAILLLEPNGDHWQAKLISRGLKD